jgi:2',3'-cyclic-nucleotide 2'-phosphodiesterase (5'-nucleotidase family)
VWNEGVETLMLEGGDLFGRRARKEQQETEFLCEQTAAFGMDAIGFGEADLNYGLPFLRKMIEKHKLPFTCANVRDAKTGELLLPEFLVVKKNGIRFGIVSVLDPEQKIITMNPDEGEFRVDDPVATLRQVLPRLRGLCDTVVLLAHTGESSAETILNEVTGIDVVLVGHTFKNLETERITHDAVMLAAVHEGRFIGRADLRIDPANGKVMAVEVEVIGLDETVADDPNMAAKFAAFKASLDQAKADQRAMFPRDLGSTTEEFLGSVNCRSCHESSYQSWHDSPHAKAHNSLRPQNMENEPECLVCHTTGYRYYGGYEEDGEKRHLVNVQCEACHGYGTEHARDGKWLKQAQESCTPCHDETKRPCAEQTKGHKFDYASYWEKIKH